MVPEVYICPIRIEANSKEEARSLVATGKGEPLMESLRWDYTLEDEDDEWIIEEEIVLKYRLYT